MAILSIAAMIALLTQMTLPTLQLMLFWSAIGAVVYLVAHRRTARRIERAEET